MKHSADLTCQRLFAKKRDAATAGKRKAATTRPVLVDRTGSAVEFEQDLDELRYSHMQEIGAGKQKAGSAKERRLLMTGQIKEEAAATMEGVAKEFQMQGSG